ncbi:MAG TPA: transketolase [Caulobacteraceae bacterium]|nr:transketolase [Caulobacteraceae bacterium]
MSLSPEPPVLRNLAAPDPETLAALGQLERKVLWLSTWMIHNANHLRPSRDGLKVGGHQSSSASVATLMTVLYLHTLRPQDRVAVKPHASPVFHAIQYLLGAQTRENLERFRALGGAQSYPSRTKDADDVDFSTGSVGLGVAATLFGSIVQDYVRLHGLTAPGADATGRMIAILGDAELDEGNVYEALLEGWKHDVKNLWWIVDYNRQSLDGVVSEGLFHRIEGFFRAVDWKVVSLKFGKKLEAARHGPAGEALIDWIERCPNQLYSALTFKGGAAWRERLQHDLAGTRGLPALLGGHDDDSLAALMTNLGGHDPETILEAFAAAADDPTPHCFVAYTIKGFGLPLAGHKDNHAGLMNPGQLALFQQRMQVPQGQEWEPFAGLEGPDAVRRYLPTAPFAQRKPVPPTPLIDVPELPAPAGDALSTQDAFGKILFEIARTASPLAERIVTTSPDVTASTNLTGWVNRKGLFLSTERADTFHDEKVPSPQRWRMGPKGQHIELGIAEHNLFLLLGQLGLADKFWGERLLPVGTVYDPFINRGLDPLIYACYQGARFMVVATPSGITLGPEGGAHQSINTPLIGMAQDGLSYFEPAYADELAAIMSWGFRHMQAGKDGGSVYLRLSTRVIDQPPRDMDDALRRAVVAGGYWMRRPNPSTQVAIAYCGAVAPEAMAATVRLMERQPQLAVLAVTSPDRLHAGWIAAQNARAGIGGPVDKSAASHAETLLSDLPAGAAIVTVIDGHPATLSWLGGVRRHQAHPLGVQRFGQSADIVDLFRLHGIDADAIVAAVNEAIGR